MNNTEAAPAAPVFNNLLITITMKHKMKKMRNPYLKGAEYVHKHQIRLGLTLCLVVLFVSVIAILTDPSAGGATGVLCATAGFMAIGNIDDVTDRFTSGNDIAYKVWLVNVREQIDESQTFPVPNASREVSTLPMKTGEKMRYFVAHTIPTLIGTGEKGDVTTTGGNDFVIIMGGKRAQLLVFIEQYAGDKFIIIYKSVTESEYYIIGSYDRPMVLQSYENKNDGDGRYVTFTFHNDSLEQSHKYVGSIITADPAVHDGTATLAIPSDNSVISIPSGSGANAVPITGVSGLTASDAGRVITLLGTGTEKLATIADNSTFVMAGGSTWTAKAGSKISFQVLDASTLVEVLGSRVQTA